MRLALVLVAVVILAGCSAAAPTLGPTPTPVPPALAHIERTSARLKGLIAKTGFESFNAVLDDLSSMVDTLQAETMWLQGNMDPSSASEALYLDRVTKAIRALDHAVNGPDGLPTETLRAARSAVAAAATAADTVVTLGGT